MEGCDVAVVPLYQNCRGLVTVTFAHGLSVVRHIQSLSASDELVRSGRRGIRSLLLSENMRCSERRGPETHCDAGDQRRFLHETRFSTLITRGWLRGSEIDRRLRIACPRVSWYPIADRLSRAAEVSRGAESATMLYNVTRKD